MSSNAVGRWEWEQCLREMCWKSSLRHDPRNLHTDSPTMDSKKRHAQTHVLTIGLDSIIDSDITERIILVSARH